MWDLYNKNVKTTNNIIKILLLLSILPVLGMISTLYYTYSEVSFIEREYVHEQTAINDSEIAFVTSIIFANYDKSKIQAIYVKENITRELIGVYGNKMNTLLADVESDHYTDAIKIIHNNIRDKYINVDNNNNDIFVTTSNRIIVDRKTNIDGERTIEMEPNYHLNSLLAKNTLDLILNSTTDNTRQILFWRNDAVSEVADTFTTPSLTNIQESYKKYGLESLRSYDFLVPVYIKDNVDLLGAPHVLYNGKVNKDNAKIIIVQTYNVYDVIDKNYRKNIERFKIDRLDIQNKADFKRRICYQNLVFNLFVMITVLLGMIFTIYTAKNLHESDIKDGNVDNK